MLKNIDAIRNPHGRRCVVLDDQDGRAIPPDLFDGIVLVARHLDLYPAGKHTARSAKPSGMPQPRQAGLSVGEIGPPKATLPSRESKSRLEKPA
jgi:hypothetical protein